MVGPGHGGGLLHSGLNASVSHCPARQEVVIAWDLDETLIVFNSLINGTYISAQHKSERTNTDASHSPQLDAQQAETLGQHVADSIFDFLDAHLLYQQVERLDPMHLADMHVSSSSINTPAPASPRHAGGSAGASPPHHGASSPPLALGCVVAPQPATKAPSPFNSPTGGRLTASGTNKRSAADTPFEQCDGLAARPTRSAGGRASMTGGSGSACTGASLQPMSPVKAGTQHAYKLLAAAPEVALDGPCGMLSAHSMPPQLPGEVCRSPLSAAAAAWTRRGGSLQTSFNCAATHTQLFTQIATIYGNGLAGLPLSAEERATLYKMKHSIDGLCAGWVQAARDLLQGISSAAAAQGVEVHHCIVTTGQLVATLGKLLMFGLAHMVPADHVYSASKQTKLAAFKRVRSRWGVRAHYLAVGDGAGEERAAAAMRWPFIKIHLAPCPHWPPGRPVNPGPGLSPVSERASAARVIQSHVLQNSGGGSVPPNDSGLTSPLDSMECVRPTAPHASQPPAPFADVQGVQRQMSIDCSAARVSGQDGDGGTPASPAPSLAPPGAAAAQLRTGHVSTSVQPRGEAMQGPPSPAARALPAAPVAALVPTHTAGTAGVPAPHIPADPEEPEFVSNVPGCCMYEIPPQLPQLHSSDLLAAVDSGESLMTLVSRASAAAGSVFTVHSSVMATAVNSSSDSLCGGRSVDTSYAVPPSSHPSQPSQPSHPSGVVGAMEPCSAALLGACQRTSAGVHVPSALGFSQPSRVPTPPLPVVAVVASHAHPGGASPPRVTPGSEGLGRGSGLCSHPLSRASSMLDCELSSSFGAPGGGGCALISAAQAAGVVPGGSSGASQLPQAPQPPARLSTSQLPGVSIADAAARALRAAAAAQTVVADPPACAAAALGASPPPAAPTGWDVPLTALPAEGVTIQQLWPQFVLDMALHGKPLARRDS